MNCKYCEKEIVSGESFRSMVNRKTEEKAFFHYPDCFVRFTTFYKTEKELKEKGLIK
jgi:hypothetical protein